MYCTSSAVHGSTKQCNLGYEAQYDNLRTTKQVSLKAGEVYWVQRGYIGTGYREQGAGYMVQGTLNKYVLTVTAVVL